MANAQSNDDLNQRLRSMILGNAQDSNQNIRSPNVTGKYANEDSAPAEKTTGHAFNNPATHPANGSRRGMNQNVRVASNQDRTDRGFSRGRADFRNVRDVQTSRDLTQPGSQPASQPLPRNDQRPTVLQHPHRGRGMAMSAASTPRGSMNGSRGGARPSGFKPLTRPRQPTADEIQAQGFYLEQLAREELPKIEMTQEECESKELHRCRLESVLQEAVAQHYLDNAPQIKLVPFGSLASGFAMPGSDMDLALISPDVPEDMPRLLESTLLNHQLGARLLTRTRVPILKVCERPTPELYESLRDERVKWDKMTPEEKEEHDSGTTTKKKELEKTEELPAQLQESNKSTDAQHASQSNIENEDAADDDEAVSNRSKHADLQSVDGTSAEDATPSKSRTPTTPAAQRSLMPPQHLEYLHLLEAVKKDKASQLDVWVAANPPPPGFNLSAALHGKMQTRAPRKERPWYREKPLGPLDFPKHSVGILSDINFSNPLGIHNTALLHAYSTCDIRVRLLVLFVKLWASRRKINSGYNGSLSSYGYVLMVLHYLVNVASPPVCPNLQLWETRSAEHSKGWPPTRVFMQPDPINPNHVCEGADVRFHRNEGELADLARRQLLTHNREPLGILLRNFFIHYATQGPNSPNTGFNWTRDVLSLRSPGGLLSKVEKGWTGAKTTEAEGGKEVKHRYLFAIEDPFELGHNVGRTVTHYGIVAIRDEFRRAARILEKIGRGERHNEGALLDTVVVEVPKKENEDQETESKPHVTAESDETKDRKDKRPTNEIDVKGHQESAHDQDEFKA